MKSVVRMGAVLVVGLVLAGCLVTKTTATATVTPPEPGVTAFGSAFSMDEGRLVVRAVRSGEPVVYVYDAAGAGWTHSATIAVPDDWSYAWGTALAVSGDTIAITDPARDGGGVVTLYDRRDGAWHSGQTFGDGGGEWTNYAAGVWLGGDGLLIRTGIVCDLFCNAGRWELFRRNGTEFQPAINSPAGRSGKDLSVGVDGGHFAIGNPGFFETDYGSPFANALMVVDTDAQPPQVRLDEVVPTEDQTGEPTVTGIFGKVDLSGDVLAYEGRSGTDRVLTIRRYNGTTYQQEATFPLTFAPASVSVLPGAVLVADPVVGAWHVYAYWEGAWQQSSDLAAPEPATAFGVPPVAVGNKVAVRGNGVIRVLTVEVVNQTAS